MARNIIGCDEVNVANCRLMWPKSSFGARQKTQTRNQPELIFPNAREAEMPVIEDGK